MTAERTRELRRWVATGLIAALVATVCVVAGMWQWSRHVDRSAAVATVHANHDAPPVPLDQAIEGSTVHDDDQWQPVRVRGRYVPDGTVLLRNRPVSGQPALHVLAPLVVEGGPLDGHVVLVNRGWVPAAWEADDIAVPPPPAGPVEVLGRLRAEEPPSGRPAPPGQVQSSAISEVRAAVPGWPDAPSVSGYLAVVTEDGDPLVGLGAFPRPTTDLGSHMSYAFQWWVFALGAIGGAVVLARRDRAATAAGSPRTPPRCRRPTAEEEEDAILDQQMH
ncbi:SURF1 family cytochrome oxidase biogenesis protein [Cellulomonas bogoriensis]|uniref:SURF1-like protein n=1 Tax=Cellulomonas bogoriensis 69B4 = DSM 16987 TaxID=1386082 RepID=A0A0A0BZ35_9CELL|nr:SURF1 family protein [Cellulomonas bogoriensis]KGM13658.1 hypothetical protein N869_11650 [Cellulomonas bogoriensis 69B4 = DSM 16987]